MDLRDELKDRKKINRPDVNIRAGIAYPFTRMAKFENRSVCDKIDTKTHEYIVKSGDNLGKIARHVGSTVEEMTKLNPGVKVIDPNQKIKYVKAKIKKVIVD
jgi:LysM domain